jgi:hypothetical protein
MTPDRYEAEAAEFFRRNPHVYDAFRMLAFKAINAGKERCSQRLLWERLRWELYISSDADVADYALNNNFCRHAAKRLVQECPHDIPAGFFQFRERRQCRTVTGPLAPTPTPGNLPE